MVAQAASQLAGQNKACEVASPAGRSRNQVSVILMNPFRGAMHLKAQLSSNHRACTSEANRSGKDKVAEPRKNFTELVATCPSSCRFACCASGDFQVLGSDVSSAADILGEFGLLWYCAHHFNILILAGLGSVKRWLCDPFRGVDLEQFFPTMPRNLIPKAFVLRVPELFYLSNT